MNLYHYTSAQGLEGIINSSSLHCTNIMFLNDPSEHSYFDSILQEVIGKKKLFENIYRAMFNTSFVESVVQPTEQYVGSFSKNGDSLSMWNYYSNGGYNLELDVDSIIADAQKADIELVIRRTEIIYDRLMQLKAMNAFFKKWEAGYSEYMEWEVKDMEANGDYGLKQEAFHYQAGLEADFTEELEALSVSLKHSAYNREEEVRLIIQRNPASDPPKNFRLSSNGVFVEFIPLPLDLSKHIKSVMIHPLNGTLYHDGLERFLNSKVGYGRIPIKMSKIPFREV